MGVFLILFFFFFLLLLLLGSAVHDAVERNDVETLALLIGRNKEETQKPPLLTTMSAFADPASGFVSGEQQPVSAAQAQAQAGEGKQEDSKAEAADQEMKPAEDAEDSDDASDKDFGAEEEEEDEDEDSGDDSDEDEQENVLDVRDDSSCTPLHIALLNGSLECLKLLLKEGADTGVGCEGNPLMHIAVSVGALERFRPFSLDAMKAIMDHCGKMENVQITDDFRRTPLHLAADIGLLNVAKLLLSTFQNSSSEGQPEMDVSSSLRDYLLSRDKLGNTCLHYAACRGHYEMVDLILNHAQEIKLNDEENLGGLLCTTKNFQKCVPLHLAVRRGYAKIAARLLVADAPGQSLKSKNILGNTALADAKAYGHGLIREKVLLAKKSGNPLSPSDAEVLALEARRAKIMKKSKTLIIRSDACENHFTCRPSSLFRGFLNSAPPENVNRLKVLTSPDHGGILTATEFGQPEYLWENDPPKAKMSDVLRVHEWHYIRHVQEVCDTLSDHADDVDGIGSLDGDTQISRFTFDAAFVAAGASILGVDKVMEASENSGISRVFCAVRPPGHHAGPTGAVSGSSTDPTIPMKGQSHSHGFCLLNNVAVAAAYAMNVHRNKIKRVAIVDFDVHHGNGTEACVSSVTPTVLEQRLNIGGNDGSGTYAFQGSVKSHKFKPWFDVNDSEAILFASCQGYGESLPGTGHMFYPGTGATYDTKPPPFSESDSMEYLNDEGHEFTYRGGSRPYLGGPRIVNVGIKGPKSERSLWKRAWRDKILPAVASHKPDLIFISAGFDAHAKDDMNSGYIGMLECDYEWVTNELVKIANKYSEGRIVSVLEGGYRIQGGLVSPFARSVASHVRALAETNLKEWSSEEGKLEREREIRIEQEKRRKQQEELLQLLAEKEDIAGQGHVLDSGMDLKMDQPAAEAPAPTNEGPSSPKRRRRAATSIDYVALNAQLEKEAQASKAPPAN